MHGGDTDYTLSISLKNLKANKRLSGVNVDG